MHQRKRLAIEIRMKQLDQFFDTREKRKAFFTLVTCIYGCYLLFLLMNVGFHLYQVKSYDALYALLEVEAIQKLYFIRVLLEIMSIPIFRIQYVVQSFLDPLQVQDMVWIGLFLIYIPHVKSSKRMKLCLFSMIACGMICVSLFVVGLSSTSLQMAITLLHWIAYVIWICSAFTMYLFTQKGIQMLYVYKEQFKYEVIEEIET